MVFRVSIALVALLVLIAGMAPGPFNALMQAGLTQVVRATGWLYLLVVFLALLFMLYLAFGRLGQLRIGGEDAEPDFSRGSWLAMLFAAGMGIGLVFWGAAEPISHYVHPPEGLEPQSTAAARAAMRYAFFHWGLHPWAVYALVGLAMAWLQYNRNGRGLVSDMLQPVIGELHKGLLGHVVNIAAVVATAIGVATTLGFGTIQIAAGLERVLGITATVGVQLATIAVAFVLYMASSTSGVERGIKWLSSANLVLAGLLMLTILVFGPTGFILDTFTTTLGSYINQLTVMSLRMSPFSNSTWAFDWTVFYWAWWIAWAPFVGAFIARVSRGRTVREFVVGVVLAPSLWALSGLRCLAVRPCRRRSLATWICCRRWPRAMKRCCSCSSTACPCPCCCRWWRCCCSSSSSSPRQIQPCWCWPACPPTRRATRHWRAAWSGAWPWP